MPAPRCDAREANKHQRSYSKFDRGDAMKRVTTAFAAAAMIAGSMTAFALDDDPHYKDLYEPKRIDAVLHNSVAIAAIAGATKTPQGADLLELWADDGTLIV